MLKRKRELERKRECERERKKEKEREREERIMEEEEREKVEGSKLVINESLVEECVMCYLSVDSLIDVERTDYVMVESIVVNSNLISFGEVVIANEPEFLVKECVGCELSVET